MDPSPSRNLFNGSSHVRTNSRLPDEEAAVNSTTNSKFKNDLADLARDATRMLDLQIQLFSVDIKAAWGGARFALAAMFFAAAAIAGSIPVFVGGLALLLNEHLNVDLASSFLLVGASVLLLMSLILVFSVRRLASAAQHLKQSRDELAANMKWFRDILHRNE